LRNVKWYISIAFVAGMLFAAWWALHRVSDVNTTNAAATSPPALAASGSTSIKNSPTFPPGAGSGPDQASALISSDMGSDAWGNLLETSADLRDVFDSLKGNQNPVAKNVAYRAWAACFPTFISAEGEPANLERILNTIPPGNANTNARRDAYRSLYQRCAGFFKMNRDTTLLTTQVQQDGWNRGASLAPGELATKLLRDGETEQALLLARRVIESKNAYAIASLQEFVHLSLVLKRDAGDARSGERADVIALSYAVAACQLGLECGPTSLTALRLCANGGQCEGSATDRMLTALSNPKDRQAVASEAQRIAAAIQAGDVAALGFSKKN
jgi:hypothetical protein